jgi:hypothetical protein
VCYHAENVQRPTPNVQLLVNVPSISQEMLLECDTSRSFIVALLGRVDETNQRDLLPK